MFYVHTHLGEEVFLEDIDRCFASKPTQENPVSVVINGTLWNACICLALKTLYGQASVIGVTIPYLATQNLESVRWIQQTCCRKTLTIPITMPIADLCNELAMAGVCVEQKAVIDRIYSSIHGAVVDSLCIQGHIFPPALGHSASEDLVRTLAVQMDIPVEMFTKVFDLA